MAELLRYCSDTLYMLQYAFMADTCAKAKMLNFRHVVPRIYSDGPLKSYHTVKLLLSAPSDPEACSCDCLVPIDYPPTGIGSKLSKYYERVS